MWERFDETVEGSGGSMWLVPLRQMKQIYNKRNISVLMLWVVIISSEWRALGAASKPHRKSLKLCQNTPHKAEIDSHDRGQQCQSMEDFVRGNTRGSNPLIHSLLYGVWIAARRLNKPHSSCSRPLNF